MEYSGELPAKGHDGNPWKNGQGEIEERTKNKTIKVVASFANKCGGLLVLGVKYRPDTPSVAGGIREIPKCRELAEQFHEVIDSRICPPLPAYEVFGVPIAGVAAGVVVFRVPEHSAEGSHRDEPTKSVPIREQDHTREMTMYEIQQQAVKNQR